MKNVSHKMIEEGMDAPITVTGVVSDGYQPTFFEFTGTPDEIEEFLEFQSQFGGVYIDA